MEHNNKNATEIAWSWADQISTYRFWGLTLFFMMIVIPGIVLSMSYPMFMESYDIDTVTYAQAIGLKSVASLLGIWLAWFMVRMKNHNLLFLYAGFSVMGFLLMLFFPSSVTFLICSILTGLGSGAIVLAIPSMISLGSRNSEMFVVSFGIVTAINILSSNSISFVTGWLYNTFHSANAILLLGLLSAVIGITLLIPVKSELFNFNPPVRQKFLNPTYRNPIVVVLLCLVPIFNLYYVVHLYYRFHGEINKLNPSQDILSPRTAAWCSILLPMISPIILASLNKRLTIKLDENNYVYYYKDWLIILFVFIFVPVSYALIQSNINKLLKNGNS